MKLMNNDPNNNKPNEAQKDNDNNNTYVRDGPEYEALTQFQTQEKQQLDQLVQNMLQKQNVQNFFSQLNQAQLQALNQQNVVNLPLELFNFSLNNHNNNSQLSNEQVVLYPVSNNDNKQALTISNEISKSENFLARVKIDFNFTTKK